MAITEETFHFYLPNGNTCHGTVEEGLAAGAYPSVTTVLSLIRKDFVEKWKIREGIAASKLLPQKDGEDNKEYANRCITHCDRMQSLTTTFGTTIHRSIEEFNLLHMAWKKGEIHTKPTAALACLGREESLPWINHYITWFHQHVEEVIAAEGVSISNQEEYAGTIDAVVRLKNGLIAILDFKTQKLKEKRPWGQKPRLNPKIALPGSVAGTEKINYWPASFYETWLLQLCAYRKSLEEGNGLLADTVVSLAINSQEPYPIQDKFWKASEYSDAYAAFLNALNLWRWINQYHPKKTA